MKINNPNHGLLSYALFIVLAIAAYPAFSSDMKIGSACEGAWGDGYLRPLPPEQTQKQRALAERGDAQAQFFMGVVTADIAESNQWLQKAIASGSKGAAAYYAYRRDPRLSFFNDPEHWEDIPGKNHLCWWPKTGLSETDQTEILSTIIAAAEAGEPQPATWLWQIVTGGTRLGGLLRNCKVSHPLLKASDAPKWAEIAARGGNPWAQEELCWAYTGVTLPQRVRAPDAEWGFQADPAKAFQWCSIIVQNDCGKSSFLLLADLYERGIGVEKSPEMARYWRNRWGMMSGPLYRYGNTSVKRLSCGNDQ